MTKKLQIRASWLSLVLLALCLGALTLFANYQLRKNLKLFSKDFLAQLEDTYNFNVTYDRMRINSFYYFQIDQLKLESAGQSISVKNLRIYLAWWKLIFHDKSLDLVQSIEVNDVSVYISEKNLQAKSAQKIEQQILQDKVPLQAKAKAFFTYLFDLFGIVLGQDQNFSLTKIDIKRLNLTVDAVWGNLHINDMYASVLPTKTTIDVDMQATIQPSFTNFLQEKFNTSLKGSISRQSKEGDITFTLTPPSKIFLLRQNMKFRARWQNHILEIEKVVDSIPLDFSFKLDVEQRYAYLGFNAKSMNIGKFIDFPTSQGSLESRGTLSSNWNGSASMLYYPDMDMCYYEATGTFDTNYTNNKMNLDIDFSGNNMTAEVKKFNMQYPGGNFSYTGGWNMQNLFPYGEFLLRQNLNSKTLVLQINAAEVQNKATIRSKQFTLDGIPLGIINTDVSFLNDEYRTSIVYQTPMGKQVTAEGHLGRISEIGQWHIFAKDFPLLELVRAKVFPSFFAKWYMNWDVMLTLKPESFFVDGRRFDFSQDTAHGVSSAFVVDNGQVNVSNFMLVWGDFFTRLTLNTQLNSSQFDAKLNVLDRDYDIDGKYDKESIHVWGEHIELYTSLLKKNLRLNIEDMPVGTHNDEELTLSVHGSASWMEKFNALMSQILLKAETTSLEMKNIQIASEGGKIETIIYEDYLSRLSGQMGYRVYETQGDLQVDAVMEMAGQNGENYLVQLYYDQFWQGQISVYRLPLERLRVPGLEGSLSTNFSFEMQNSQPKLDGYVSFDGFYKNLRLAVDTGIGATEQGIQILGSHIQYGALKLLGPVALLDFTTGRVEFSTQITDVRKIVQTGITVSIEPQSYEGIGSLATLFDKNFFMLVQTNEVEMNERVLFPAYAMVVVRTEKEITVTSDTELELDFSYQLVDQGFHLDLQDNTTEIEVKVRGNVSVDNYFIDIVNLSIPLPLINPVAITPETGQRILGFTKGVLKGNFFIDNSRLVNGDIKLTGNLRSPFSPGNDFKFNHALTIRNSVMKTNDWLFQLPQGTTLMLNAALNFSGSNFNYVVRADIRNGLGATFDFDILNFVKFKGRTLGWAQYEGDLRMGYLSGRLEFPTAQGSMASLTQFIGRKENSEDLRIYKIKPPGYNVLSGRGFSYEGYGAGQQEKFAPFTLVSSNQWELPEYSVAPEDVSPEDNFRLVAGRDFTFYAPSMSLPTIQATLNPGQYVDLFMDIVAGGDRLVYLKGMLTVNRGEISYFGNKFLIEKGGTILFDKTTEVNPYLDLKADYRVDTLTNRVITMHFKNYVLDTYNPQFTSIPTLSQEQIMSILGANVSSRATENSTVSNMFASGALDTSYPQSVYNEADRERNANTNNSLGAFEQIIRTGTDTIGGSVSRMVENAVRFIPFIDTVTIKTDFISNFALDKLAGSTAESAEQRHYNDGADSFTRYLDGTSIYFGTYIDRNLFFQTKIDLEDMSTLSRYADASQLKVNFYLDFQINTPLFLVDWAFNPMQNSRDVSDNYWKFRPEVTITLSKTYAFRDWKDLYEQLAGYDGQ